MEILKVIKKKEVTPNQTTTSTKSSPPEELLSNPPNEIPDNSQLDKPKNYYYQAIGWLWATVSETDEGSVQITLSDGSIFDYKPSPRLFKRIKQHIIDTPEEPLWFLCYPSFNLQSKVLSFRGVNCKKEKPPEVESGIFTLRGVWHFIKFNRNPVFSIYRNTLQFPKDRVKNNHLTLTGLEDNPFDKEKDAPENKKFYQIEARLNPSFSCFEWVRNLEPPFYPPPPKLEKNAKFEGKPKDTETDNQQKSSVEVDNSTKQKSSTELEKSTKQESLVEVEKSTKQAEKTVVKEENKELKPQRLNRQEMSQMMGISLSKLSQLTKEASNQNEPPIISYEGKQWRYISNPEGRGKVFELF